MGNDASRITAQAHSGGRRIKLNVDSTYAEEYKVGPRNAKLSTDVLRTYLIISLVLPTCFCNALKFRLDIPIPRIIIRSRRS